MRAERVGPEEGEVPMLVLGQMLAQGSGLEIAFHPQSFATGRLLV